MPFPYSLAPCYQWALKPDSCSYFICPLTFKESSKFQSCWQSWGPKIFNNLDWVFVCLFLQFCALVHPANWDSYVKTQSTFSSLTHNSLTIFLLWTYSFLYTPLLLFTSLCPFLLNWINEQIKDKLSKVLSMTLVCPLDSFLYVVLRGDLHFMSFLDDKHSDITKIWNLWYSGPKMKKVYLVLCMKKMTRMNNPRENH